MENLESINSSETQQENQVFVPRFKDSTGTTANRRRLKIVSQVADEMVADIYNDMVDAEKGTALTAEIMNEFEKRIFDTEKASITATQTAQEALHKSAEALQHSSDNKGTRIYVAGELVASYDMDTKSDKITNESAHASLSTNLSNVSQRVSILEQKPIISEVKVEMIDGIKTFVF